MTAAAGKEAPPSTMKLVSLLAGELIKYVMNSRRS
jgi:hypothetical protein